MFTGIIIGVLGVASVAGLLAWTRSKGVSLSWYTWLVFASWLVYTLGVVAGIGAFVAEGESGAAGTFALTFLVPTVLGPRPTRPGVVPRRERAPEGIATAPW